MRKTALLFILAAFTACNHSQPAEKFPKPGTVVAHLEEPITDDTLNHFTFSVKVIADTSVDSGIYDVQVDYGPNPAAAKIVLPKGCEDAKPVMRKGAKPYTYIIGFKLNKDTTFYDYYEVSSTRDATNMRYVKSYSF